MSRLASSLTAIFLFSLALCAPPAQAQLAELLRSTSVKVETQEGIAYFFKSVSGLGSEIEVVEFREGGDPNTTRKLPGRTKYPNIVLKRGYQAPDAFFDWADAARLGQATRKNLTLTLLDRRDRPIAQFHVFRSFPAGWEVSNDRAGLGDAFVEEFTLATEGVELVR